MDNNKRALPAIRLGLALVPLALLLAVTVAVPLPAQDNPKIDSVLVRLGLPKDSTLEAVGAAFAKRGLVVTNASPFFVEADLGQTGNALGFSVPTHRVVRAVIFAIGESTTVVLTGEEVRKNSFGQQIRRLRIDNRAGGNGEKAWCRMVAVALELDSLQVPAAAIKADKCPKRLSEK